MHGGGARSVALVASLVISIAAAVSVTVSPLPPAGAEPVVVTAQQVVTGLGVPSMFTVAPDGRIFFAERQTGRIGVVSPVDRSTSTFFLVPDVCGEGDAGLFGVAVRPTFPSAPAVYAYAARRGADGTCSNQVLRIDPGPTMTVLHSHPVLGEHQGGRLLFGPDGNLYISTGDGAGHIGTEAQIRAQQAFAQDVASPRGKILRVTPEGTAAAGNPFGNLVYAYGFRNPFGFDFDPSSGRLWVADNGPGVQFLGDPPGPGPDGGCNDELDVVAAGANLGWGPKATCGKPPEAPLNTNQDGPAPVLPSLNIEAASGITGARFCSSCGLGPANEGRLFWIKYSYLAGGAEIHGATLGPDRTTITSDEVVFRPPRSDALSIERGPDGALYYSDATSIWKLVLGEPTTGFLLNLSQPSPTAVKLQWSGASGASIDIFRRSSTASAFTKVATSSNDGNGDNIPGAGAWDYRVCVAGTTTCSNVAGAVTVAGAGGTPTTTTTATSTTTTTTSAPPPSGIVLNLTRPLPTLVHLAWRGATASKIDIFRAPSGSGAFTRQGTSGNDGSADNAPGPGTWDFRVCHAGTTTCSNIATITVDGTTTTSTSAPSGFVLTLTKPSPTLVHLSWKGATASSIDIFRRPSGSGSFTKQGTSSNDGSADNAPGPGTWDFRVCHAGTSTCSNTATITV